MAGMTSTCDSQVADQNTARRVLAELADEYNSPHATGMDRLRIGSAPLVPEIQLHLAEDAVLLWARLEARLRTRVAAPFWASAWIGGQALARYVLDNPVVVRGQRVLDLGSGSGLVGIAAAKAGAASVMANDIDPYAMTVIGMNAHLNRVGVTADDRNLLSGDADGFDVILAGDALYDGPLADGMLAFLIREHKAGRRVLIGDPSRGYLPERGLRRVATYSAASLGTLADSEILDVCVFEMD
jgi:predicted nicotinamide N-methyase